MAKVNVGDLRAFAKSKGVGSTISISVGGMDIEIVDHISITEKLSVAGSLFNASIIEENDTHLVDGIMYDVFFVNLFMEQYTNVRLPENKIDAYDLLINTGVFKIVYEAMDETEREELERIISNYFDMKKEEYLQENSTSKVLMEIMEGIVASIPNAGQIEEMFSKLGQETEGVDFNEMSEVASMVDGLGTADGEKTKEEKKGDEVDGSSN